MNVSKSTKNQIKILILPIIWHVLYLIFTGQVDKSNRVYYDSIFYMGIVIYFLSIKCISLSNIFIEWKKGKRFWLPVLYTVLGIIVAFGIGIILSSLISLDDGMGSFRVYNVSTLLAFILTTIILPPIAEELFYRKGFIVFDSKLLMIMTSILGILLYASEHSLQPLGLLKASFWAIPFTVSYIKTKNIYISITAHFITNLLMNGYSVIMIANQIFN